MDKADDVLQQLTSHQIELITCPRCGEKHANVRFDPIQNPSDGLFRHWWYCPDSFSPVLLYWDGETARIK